jgi:hypothetical protein
VGLANLGTPPPAGLVETRIVQHRPLCFYAWNKAFGLHPKGADAQCQGVDAQCLDHVKVEIVTHLHETSIYRPSRLTVGLMRLRSDSITMT